jgi:LacI family transcriptional regulator
MVAQYGAFEISSKVVKLAQSGGHMRKPGMAALAAAAGVSVATVDRVLNGREAVRADTVALVAAAAAAIGHPAARRLGATPGAPALRIGVLLHKGGQAFYQNFACALEQAVTTMPGATLVLEFATSQSPTEVAGLMRTLATRCDVMAATAVNHPDITEAVSDVQAMGVPIFALLSDFAQGIRAGYVGLNNLKSGRVAAWTMAMAAKEPGTVAVFVGGARWMGHEQRDKGFRAYLREAAPHLRVLDTLVNLETRALTHDATVGLLARQTDLRGIYVAGGGMEGAIAALRDARAPGVVALVVPELIRDSRDGLKGGWVTLVCGTPLPQLTRDLVDLMAKAAQSGVVTTGGAAHFLPPELFVGESI